MNDPAGDLRRLARDMERAGRKVRQEIPARMRRAAVPMIRDIRSETQILPERGGFANYIRDSTITIQTVTGAHHAGVTVVGLRRKTGGFVDLRGINRGRLRHPVFGNEDRWRTQQIPAGFWDNAVARHRSAIYGELEHLMDEIKHDLEATQ